MSANGREQGTGLKSGRSQAQTAWLNVVALVPSE